jgi:hypothetical protein
MTVYIVSRMLLPFPDPMPVAIALSAACIAIGITGIVRANRWVVSATIFFTTYYGMSSVVAENVSDIFCVVTAILCAIFYNISLTKAREDEK